VPEPSAIEGVLNALVEAIEAREAAEPDLPAWESIARVHKAETALLRAYRESGPSHHQLVAIDIDIDDTSGESVIVEVA